MTNLVNKTELFTFLRKPNQLTPEQLEELEEIVNENPYFLSARLLLAKASKEKQHPKTKKRIASAAIYSTDRILLKKYLSSDLFFLKEPPKPEEEDQAQVTAQKVVEKEKPVVRTEPKQPTSKPAQRDREEVIKPQIESNERKAESPQKPPVKAQPKTLIDKSKEKPSKPQPKIPELPSGQLDSILEELKRDMKNLKSSREKFAKVQDKIVEEDAVSEALKKVEHKTDDPSQQEVEKIDTSQVTNEKNESDEAKQKALEITRAIIEKAKSEVQEEENKAKEQSEEIEEKETESTMDDIKPKVEEPKVESEEKKVEEAIEKEESKEDDTGDKEDFGRAERTIREPRFSRFEQRSTIKPPEDMDTSFLDDSDDQKEVKKEEQESPEKTATSKTTEEKKEEDSKGKIKLPDLSKAKPVERKSKRKPKTSETIEGEKEKPKSKQEKVETKKTEEVKTEKEKKTVTSKKAPATKASSKTDSKKSTSKKTIAKKAATKKESPKKAASKKETTAKKTTKEKSTSKSKKTKKEDKKDDGKSDRKAQSEIIDKFIKESPSIKYQRKEDESHEDLAEESASWDANLASEYLAEIYLNQGNKKRAIQIYEALILKYPEKKSYFADLISKIK